ncbi:unnamed protein product [Chrysoparadoxa australica]
MRILLASLFSWGVQGFLGRPSIPHRHHTYHRVLNEGEELLDTITISPEDILAQLAEPTFTPEIIQGSSKAAGAPLLESNPQHIRVVDSFLSEEGAKGLRSEFVDRQNNPREGAGRFIWDYWHIPQQYTLLRCPAESFFTPDAYEALVDALCQFGQERLGCSSISPPWLSLYVDGCEQGFHTDSWHGPHAFVYSLSDPDSKAFEGGETQIMKPHTLNYWQSFQPGIGLESQHLLDRISADFNRLVVFDPRSPHGVTRVSGTKDPLKGRLVVHGWFTEPQPFFSGGLTEEGATYALNKALEQVYKEVCDVGRVTGVLTVKLAISGEDGKVKHLRALSDTLIPDPNDMAVDEEGFLEDARADLLLVLHEVLQCVAITLHAPLPLPLTPHRFAAPVPAWHYLPAGAIRQ